MGPPVRRLQQNNILILDICAYARKRNRPKVCEELSIVHCLESKI